MMSSLPTGTSSGASSPTRKEQPLFSLRQVGMICERLLKEREDKIREDYDEMLTTKLAGVVVIIIFYHSYFFLQNVENTFVEMNPCCV